MATARTPESTRVRRTRCRSTGPGVVSPPPPGSARPSLPTSTPSVPIEAAGAWGESSRWRSMDAIVDFPLVPVTPTSDSDRPGLP